MTDARDARQRSHDARRHGIRTPADALSRAIERGTERITSARVIAKALNEGTQAKAELGRMSGKGMQLPRLAGVASALEKLKHSLEARAEKLMQRVEATDARGGAVFDRADAHIDGAHVSLDSVNAYIDQVEQQVGGNGGPLDG